MIRESQIWKGPGGLLIGSSRSTTIISSSMKIVGRSRHIMTWSCRYCTFTNADDLSTTCSLCGMPGKRKLSVSHTGIYSKIVDVTGGRDSDHRTKPQSLKRPLHSKAASSIVTAAASTNRKCKSPSFKKNDDHKKNVHHDSSSVTNRPKYSLDVKVTTKTSTTTSANLQVKQTSIQYPHTFSYKLVPKRNPDEIKRDVQRALENIFNLKCLRNLQPQAVQCALQLQSQMIVMATGGGK
jgi:hypothetical protein